MDGSSLHNETPPCLGKDVEPLVPAVIRGSLTVVTGRQKPESLTAVLPRGIVLPSYWVVEVR